MRPWYGRALVLIVIAQVHVKSEPIPEDNDEPVKVAVGLNFDDLVINNDKDVLVECAQC